MPTRYDVVMGPKAEDDLAELWRAGSHLQRLRITKAAQFMQTYLSQDAHLKGIRYPHQPTRRFVVKHPLVVHFDVSEPDRRVTILAVHATKNAP